ncbi:MAG: MobV family relaxase, partial [Gammaproteobacteria bacterium]
MAAAAKHNLRERETFNARQADVGRNIHLAGARTSDELAKLWEERAPEKVRKNAVHALEYVITASPEKMQEMGQTNSENYLRDALTWLQEKHGTENILSAVIHNDETTPHLQVMVIPLDERGKLNARALVGGKAQLSAMQTDFAERVGAKYDLDRGIRNSKALHYDIKSYYARVNSNEMATVELPERATGGFMGRG